METIVIHPGAPHGSPPRPSADDLGRIGYEELRAHGRGVSLVSGAALPDWLAVAPEVREAWRTAGEAIAVAVAAPRAVLAALHDNCAETIGSLEDRYAAATAANDDLHAVIAAAGPHQAPADLAPLLYEAYIGRVRAATPDGIAFAGWDQLGDDPMAVLARDAFTAAAQVALEPVQADYDQAAVLLTVRSQRDTAVQRVAEMAFERDSARDALDKILHGLTSGEGQPLTDEDVIAIARKGHGGTGA